MNNIVIEILTENRNKLLSDLLDPDEGSVVIKLTDESSQLGMTGGTEACLLEFALQFGIGISSGVIANWIFNKIQNTSTKLWIEDEEILIEKEHIERIIIKKVTKKSIKSSE